ncbi:AI-2E family transporter [Arthrobacter cryoconiti]|nr:AI-2E family transporter [Arthrobacter cryoconiti]MCC9068916.1 AI-2E family transporter [Arthrobacter cryoconiti]
MSSSMPPDSTGSNTDSAAGASTHDTESPVQEPEATSFVEQARGVDQHEIIQPGPVRAGGWRAWLVKKISQPIPGAQPRVRFSLPNESLGIADIPAPAVSAEQTETMGLFRHPIYYGFMGTVGVGIALAVSYIMSNTSQLLLWIVTALFIALGLDPVVRWLERRSVPRPVGIVLVLVTLLGIVAIFFATLIPTIVTQTTQLINKAPGWITDFFNSDFFRNIDGQYHVLDTINEQVAKFFQDAQAVGGIFGGVLGVGTTIANGLFGTLIVLVLSLYFLASLPAIKRWGYRLAPRSRRARVEELSEEITRGVGNYVIGQVCVAVINATVAFIIMSILHVPFSVLLAFVVALLAFIPLVGGMIAAVVVIAVSLTVGWQTALIYAICYLAYLQFEAYFVSPRIMQKAVAVPGAIAVISVIAGGSLLGVLGALIAIPTAAAVMLLVKEVFIARQDKH